MKQVNHSWQRGCRTTQGRDVIRRRPLPGHMTARKRGMPAVTCRRRSGFTLVELLVTLAIIAVLAALSTLGVRSMKNAAEAAKSMGNLKNLGVAAATASTDNNGKYPAMRVFPWDPDGYLADTDSGFYSVVKPGSIGEVLGPYLGAEPVSTMDVDPALMPEIFQCFAATQNSSKRWINRFGAYRFNYYAIGRAPGAADAMIFIDTCWNDWAKADFSHQNPTGLNVAYADGHVTFMDYAAYTRLNPASSAEKKNRFFTQGWLD